MGSTGRGVCGSGDTSLSPRGLGIVTWDYEGEALSQRLAATDCSSSTRSTPFKISKVSAMQQQRT